MSWKTRWFSRRHGDTEGKKAGVRKQETGDSRELRAAHWPPERLPFISALIRPAGRTPHFPEFACISAFSFLLSAFLPFGAVAALQSMSLRSIQLSAFQLLFPQESGRCAAVCGFAASVVRSQRSASRRAYAQLMMQRECAGPLATKDQGRCRRHQTAAPAARRISWMVASPPSGRYAAVCGFAASLVRGQRSASQHPYAQLMMLCVRALP